MAKNDAKQQVSATPKKADLILQTDREIQSQVNDLSSQMNSINEKLAMLTGMVGSGEGQPAATSGGVAAMPSVQLNVLINTIKDECTQVKREIKYLAAQNESIYNELTERLDKLSAKVDNAPYDSSRPAYVAGPVQAEIDYEHLAKKIVELMPAQEYISPDYIACKVAEQIVVPETTVVTQGVAPEVRVVNDPVAVDVQIDEDELADKIALKVGALKAEDFDILVDDEGCTSISKEIVEKLDYDLIAAEVAERLRAALDVLSANETDYEEMASRISENITVAGINEDAIADKAAEALSNYLPDIDTDDIADKVASQLIGVMPAVDSEAISTSVAEKIIENQSDRDYDIVIDEDGINIITEHVTAEVQRLNEERFDSLENELNEIKAMLADGAVVREVITTEVVDEAAYGEQYVAEEPVPLVTVSDVVEEEELIEEVEEEPEEIVEEYVEEAIEEPEEEISEEDIPEEEYTEEEVLDSIVSDIDEEPAEGEYDLDDAEGVDGVDFKNMMKFNRSFIARIIQGSDEQKQYYGAVKNALLSYKKVNSNVAWGAERFNKGRETIARFKIRGKTLCLYLALDPSEHEYSVYHQVDVSDNKSMHGTPMMVKVKSPRGVKKAIRLVDEMLAVRDGIKLNNAPDRDYAAMYPYETIDELIEDGLVKDVRKNK